MQSPIIGKKLKNIRQARGMTLDEAAELTGVSKPMLGQIERGQSSPTVNTLWKIATGLKVPLSSFLRDRESELSVARPSESAMITEENGAMRAYTLFTFDPLHNLEAFYIEFDAGCTHRSDGHCENIAETVFVISGRLDITVNGQTVTLSENQAARFSADVPHIYANPYDKQCRIYNMIFY